MTSEAKKEARWPRLVLMVLLISCLVLGGIYARVRFLAQGANPKASPVPGPMYELEPFYVNLAEERGRGYLKAVIVLDLAHPKLEKEIERYQAIVRDEIIRLLRKRSIAELQEEGNYEEIKLEIKRRLNQILPAGGIDAVYFTEFLISY